MTITDPITVRVPGAPKGQPRPRAFSFGGKARMYDPGTAEGWKASVAHAVTQARRDLAMIEGPVGLNITFLMPRPKYLLKRSSPPGRIPFTGKPDFDNLAKAVADAITVIGGVWHDDAQVTDSRIVKRYAAINELPGAEITIFTPEL